MSPALERLRTPARPVRCVVHTCPICAREHSVSDGRAELAYGRQLACCPDCEGERRRRARAEVHAPGLPEFDFEKNVVLPTERRARLGASEVAVIAVMLALLAGAFALRLWIYFPRVGS